MNSRFQPGEETFDDVAGHELTSQDPVDDEETEGHRMPPSRGPVGQDQPGHRGPGSKFLPVDDEVEGHRTPTV